MMLGYPMWTFLLMYSSIAITNGSYYCNHRWISSVFYDVSVSFPQSISLNGPNGQDAILIRKGSVTGAGGLTEYYISDASSSGTFHPIDDINLGPYCTTTGDQLYAVDIDGDSRDDLLCNKVDGSFSVKYYMNGKKFTNEESIADGFRCVVDSTSPVNKLLIGDFDGNNADDFMCVPIVGTTSAAGSVIHFNGACPKNYHYSENHNYHREHIHETIGRPSSHHHKRSHSHHGRDFIAKQCSFEFPKTYTLPAGSLSGCDVSANKFILGDSNGDGRDDVICQIVSGGPYVINTYLSLFNTAGGGAFSATPVSLSDASICDPAAFQIQTGDVDGDGDDDLICVNSVVPAAPVPGSLEVSYFNNNQYSGWDIGIGNDCDPTDFCRGPAFTTSHIQYVVGDFNKDGKDDLMCFYRTTPSPANMRTHIVYAQ